MTERIRVVSTPQRFDVHVFFHVDLGGADPRLDHLHAQLEELLMVSGEVKAAMGRIDTATSAISDRIDKLVAKVGTGMSDAEVLEVVTGLKAEADKLEGMGKDPSNPTPGEPAPGPTTPGTTPGEPAPGTPSA